MAQFANKFPGRCWRCHEDVPAGEGLCDKNDAGKWQVSCKVLCQIKPAPVPAKRAASANVGGLDGILKLFGVAKQHLKWPAIVLGVDVGPFGTYEAAAQVSAQAMVVERKGQFYAAFPAIRTTVAGATAKVPGSLTVTEADFRDGEEQRRWLGRVLTDGTFQAAWELNDQARKKAVEARLAAFSANPAKVGGEDGRLHGRCCFCRKALSDERSTAVGYGGTCADHYGLPWGDKPAEFGAAA